jgi:hypothetical protein
MDAEGAQPATARRRVRGYVPSVRSPGFASGYALSLLPPTPLLHNQPEVDEHGTSRAASDPTAPHCHGSLESEDPKKHSPVHKRCEKIKPAHAMTLNSKETQSGSPCFAGFTYFVPLRETGLFIYGLIRRFQGKGLFIHL